MGASWCVHLNERAQIFSEFSFLVNEHIKHIYLNKAYLFRIIIAFVSRSTRAGTGCWEILAYIFHLFLFRLGSVVQLTNKKKKSNFAKHISMERQLSVEKETRTMV